MTSRGIRKEFVIIVAMFIFFAGFLVIFDEASVSHFNKDMYPIVKAESYLSLANSSDNLSQIYVYLGEANSEIIGFSGNPQWWYGTPSSSWNEIRLDIKTVQLQVISFEGTKNLSGLNYLFDISQVHSSVGTINNLLQNEYYWVSIAPLYLSLDIIYMILLVLMIFTLIYIDYNSNYYNFPLIFYIYFASVVIYFGNVIGIALL